MGWYTVVKTIKGRRYLYRQRTWREGAQVRTESQYLGPAGEAGELTLQNPAPAPLSESEAVAAWRKGKLTRLKPSRLPAKFSETLEEYSEALAAKVNPALRGDAPLTSALKTEILRLKWSLYHPDAVLAHDVTLYRGGLIRADRLKVGNAMTEAAFSSFSTEMSIAEGFLKEMSAMKGYTSVLLRLEAKNGDHGYVQMTGITRYPQEYEVICRPARFQITKIIFGTVTPIVYIERIG